MHYTLILYQNGEGDVPPLRCLLKSLQARLSAHQDDARVTYGEDSVLVRLCPLNQDLKVVDNSCIEVQWTTLNSLDIESIPLYSDTTTEENESGSAEPGPQLPRNGTWLPEYLHDLADNLPYAGYTLDIYLINVHLKLESCTLSIGAMLRLREWHGAQVKLVGSAEEQDHHMTQTLCEILHAQFLHPHQLKSVSWPLWIGMLVWPGEKGFIQRGLHLECDDMERLKDKLSDLHFWSRKSSRQGYSLEEGDPDLVLGRQLEVLTYVAVESVPLYLIDDFHLLLHVNTTSQFGQVLDTLNHRDALLLRFPLYEKGTIPVASSYGLSTAAWKEGIITADQPGPDPERYPLPCRQHLFLMITGDLKAVVLRSPSQVNTQLFEEIHQEAYFGFCHDSETQSPADSDTDSQMESMLDDLPLLTAADFHSTDDACLQSMVHCINEKKQNGDAKVEVTAGNLLSCVREGQELFLKRGQKQRRSSSDKKEPATVRDSIPFSVVADLECASSEWPERRALLENETKAKVLRRYQSNDSWSMMLSSPLGPEDSSMDAKDMVKWFKPDGNSIQEDLSPLKPAVRPPRMANHGEASLEWPACKDLQYHDVYYEHSKKSEKQEKFFQKFRDNILLEESLHVCADKPHVPALRYRNHSRRRNQMDITCGGSKLTPITRKNLSPNSMLQATPSAKRCLSRETSLEQTRSKASSGSKAGSFSAPKSRIRKHRSLSSDSSRSGKERSSQSLLVDSCEGNSRQSSSSVFYPKKADPSLPPFRRQSKPDVSIFTPSSSQKLPGSVSSGGGLFQRKLSSASLSSEEDSERRLSGENMNSAASSSASKPRESRSQRHKRVLERVVTAVLGQAGVGISDSLYPCCFSKLYQVTLFYAKQLTNSHNLKKEMWSIAEKQVEQVVDLEKRRQDLAMKNKLRKSSLVG